MEKLFKKKVKGGVMILWSEQQQAFHRGDVNDEITKNLNMYLGGRGCTDYITLGIATSYEDADKIIDYLEALRANGGKESEA